MMLYNYPFPIEFLINQLIDYIIIIFDKDLKIVDYNQRFKDIYPIEMNNQRLQDIVSKHEFSKIDCFLSQEFNYKRRIIQFKECINTCKCNYEVYMFKEKQYYWLIGRKESNNELSIINEISKLNNEVSNKSRELTKKNAALQKANKKIESLLKVDSLTGLLNRRYAFDFIRKSIAQSRRNNFPLSCIMCDIDLFKHVNDTYGHSTGDQVLSAIGEVIKKNTRSGDISARIGGEEFLIVLTHASIKSAFEYAQRIRTLVEELSFREPNLKVTISLGVTDYRKNETFESLFNRSDQALYLSKNSGRNKVTKL